jgi:hypothetical protein
LNQKLSILRCRAFCYCSIELIPAARGGKAGPSTPYLIYVYRAPHNNPSPTKPVTSDIINQLKSNEIIPDILPPNTFTPSVFFTVVYPNTDIQTNLGNKVQSFNVVDEPEITIAPLNVPKEEGGEVRYTLVMTDPDAPKRFEPKFR